MMIERMDKRFVSCPVCGRILMKGQCRGECNLDITCNRCNRDIVVHIDDERVMVLENRRGRDKDAGTGQVRVSVQKTKGKKMVPAKQAANY